MERLSHVEGNAMNDRKRELRELKRQIKQKGNRKRRRFLKRSLQTDPLAEQPEDYAFGRDSSAPLNTPAPDPPPRDKS